VGVPWYNILAKFGDGIFKIDMRAKKWPSRNMQVSRAVKTAVCVRVCLFA